ncbi:MAG: MarR family transcriptional regulator [Rhizobiales bacterium]|nr:MarR family transcriptional regulator [Hyphomicrobiales bacterium]
MSGNNGKDVPLLSQQLCFALYATSRAFTKLYAKLLTDLGVTYPQYLVLMVLWEEDGQSIHGIAQKLELEAATVTPLVKRMESLELLLRKRSREDERRIEVRLTPKGSSMREKANDISQAVGCAIGVDSEQVQKLLNKLNALRANL